MSEINFIHTYMYWFLNRGAQRYKQNVFIDINLDYMIDCSQLQYIIVPDDGRPNKAINWLIEVKIDYLYEAANSP